MTLTVIALSWLLQNPQTAAAGTAHAMRPGTVNTAMMQQSFADLTRGVLNCYHRTGRYVFADVCRALRDW